MVVNGRGVGNWPLLKMADGLNLLYFQVERGSRVMTLVLINLFLHELLIALSLNLPQPPPTGQ